MKKQYSLTSTAFEGEVLFTFNEFGLLEQFDSTGATLSEEQQLFLLRKLPRDLPGIQALLEKTPTATFTEIKREVTFEQFWNRYDEKIRSSKKRTLTAWNKLKQADRYKAYAYIQKYEQSLYQGTAKKYAETYLNAELWNN